MTEAATFEQVDSLTLEQAKKLVAEDRAKLTLEINHALEEIFKSTNFESFCNERKALVQFNIQILD